MAVALCVIGIFISLRRHRPETGVFTAAVIFLSLGLAAPSLLASAYAAWMRLARVMGWINTRVILALMFYLVFTPIGVIMRICRIDPLDRKPDIHRKSYWLEKEKPPAGLERYERQF